MALTDTAVKKAEAKERLYKMADAGGLYLHVAATGRKTWRMKFRFDGREKLLTFGAYPDVNLRAARDKRDQARAQLAGFNDPSGARRKAKEARLAAETAAREAEAQRVTFEQSARRWHDLQKPRWAPVHAEDVITSLERDVFPEIGARAVADITAPIVNAMLRKVEDRGAIETARRLRQRVSGVFAFLISEGALAVDPAASVGKALKPLPKKGKQPALTDPADARQVLIAAEASGASPITKIASRFLALTQARPGMVRGLEWAELEGIDWSDERFGPDLAIWRVPARRMKLVLGLKDEEEFEHIVPLCWQAIEALRAVRRLTGRAKLVFPSQRHIHRPLSENAIGYLYNRVGFHGRHVPHGWRAAFSTTMNGLAKRRKSLGDSDVVELMLAHVPENKVKAAYDRAGHMERRRELAQEWADVLLGDIQPAAELIGGARR